jgi:hypothetical protein
MCAQLPVRLSAGVSAGRSAFHAAASARSDIIGIDLGTTNSCVAIMEVRWRAAAACGRALCCLFLPTSLALSAPPLSLSRRARTCA